MARSDRLQLVVYGGLSFGAWLALTEGRIDGLIVGVPVTMLATLTIYWLRGPSPLAPRLAQLIPFALFFVGNSLLGGIDVACRALLPRMPIEPGFVQFRTRIEHESARVFFANAVSLLPGTLSARLDGCEIYVHVLDTSQPTKPSLQKLENRVILLFKC